MADYKQIFCRTEKKYLLSPAQYSAFMSDTASYIREDEYGESTVCSLYFDTANDRLIRRSLQAPEYKEKLRLRCYGKANETSPVFVEMKKKYAGIVYKRRVDMSCREAESWLIGNGSAPAESQITREIDYMRSFYGGLEPKMMISCKRQAYFSAYDDDLRLTFDSDIRWRAYDLSLLKGAGGEEILDKGCRLLEIKSFAALPLWLVGSLSKNRIYPTSFSKYGRGFEEHLNFKMKDHEEVLYA